MKNHAIENRDVIVWDELYDRRRPRGPGVLALSPDHVVVEVPSSTDRRRKSDTLRVTDLDGEPYTLAEVHLLFDIRRIFGWIIDLNERRCFRAHVEDADGSIVFFCSNEDVDEDDNVAFGELWLTVDGFMRHTKDVARLTEYLRSVGSIGPLDSVTSERCFRERLDELERRHRRSTSRVACAGAGVSPP